jgi:hypothetical protein
VPEATEAATEEPAANDGDNIGKQNFSTTRPKFLFRKRTP